MRSPSYQPTRVGYTRPVTTGAGHFFDAMAASYDDLEPWYEHLYGVLHGLVRTELGPPAGAQRERALDAGCGTGFQTAILLELGYETLGVDLSAGLLSMARKRCAGARLLQGDLLALPWRDETVDLVVSCGSTLSFVGDPGRAVRELARVLRPGGRLFLEVEQRWTLDLLWRLASSVTGDPLGYGATPAEARRAFGRPLSGGIWMDYPGYPRLRLFTRRELDGLLARVGLAPVRWWGIHSVTNLVPSTLLHRPRLSAALARLHDTLARVDRILAGTPLGRGAANSLVVLARKPDAPPRRGRAQSSR
jgi:MPBQ/MSBQ methyltransferase